MLLNEGRRDNELSRFIPLFQERGIDINISRLKQLLLSKFVNEGSIHNLSLGSNFYLLGVARYYFEGELTNNCHNIDELGIFSNKVDDFNKEICKKLNKVILIARNDYINAYYEGVSHDTMNEDFYGMPLYQLFNIFSSDLKDIYYETDKEYDENDNSAGSNGYTFEIMYNQKDCQKYEEATHPGSWCITYGQQHYDYYIKQFSNYGGVHYVVFKRDNYEDVPRTVSRGYPCDEYGGSLICLLQRNDCHEPTYITSRWNHGGHDSPRCEADHAYSKEEFLDVIGDDGSILEKVYSIWNNNKDKRGANDTFLYEEKIMTYKYYQMLLDGGQNVNELFNKIEVISGNVNKFNKCICQVSLDDGRTWCMSIKGKLICHKISIGKFSFKEGDNFINYYYGENDDGEYITIMTNRKFNCYLNYDEQLNYYYNNKTQEFFLNKFNFIALKNKEDNTKSFYNPSKNTFFKMPNGENEISNWEAVGDDGRSDEIYSLIKFVYHFNRDYVFYYDIESNSFVDYNKFRDYKILFKYNNYIGLKNLISDRCNIYDTSSNKFIYLLGLTEIYNLTYLGYGVIWFSGNNININHAFGYNTYDLAIDKEILTKDNKELYFRGYRFKCAKNLIILELVGNNYFYLYDALNRKLITRDNGSDKWFYYNDFKFTEKGLLVDREYTIPYPSEIQEMILNNFKRLI